MNPTLSKPALTLAVSSHLEFSRNVFSCSPETPRRPEPGSIRKASCSYSIRRTWLFFRVKVWSPLWRPFQLLGFGPEGFTLIQHIKHDVFDGRGKVADDLSHRPAAQGILTESGRPYWSARLFQVAGFLIDLPRTALPDLRRNARRGLGSGELRSRTEVAARKCRASLRCAFCAVFK